jgi:hypothetical protein
VDLQLVCLDQADLGQPVADVLPLVTLVLMLMTKLFSFVTENELERLSLASLSSLALHLQVRPQAWRHDTQHKVLRCDTLNNNALPV